MNLQQLNLKETNILVNSLQKDIDCLRVKKVSFNDPKFQNLCKLWTEATEHLYKLEQRGVV